MTEACADVDAIVHLGGISGEAEWDRIRDVNVEGACCVFEAARAAGVPRVMFASSNHAVGFHENAPELTDDAGIGPKAGLHDELGRRYVGGAFTR